MSPPVPDLGSLGLFGGFNSEALAFLDSRLHHQPVAPGEVVFREGDAGRELFILMSGEMEVLKHSERHGADARVAMLGPGDWFGEMGVITLQQHCATVRAVSASVLLKISAATIDELYRY